MSAFTFPFRIIRCKRSWHKLIVTEEDEIVDETGLISALKQHQADSMNQLIELEGDFIHQLVMHNLPSQYERGYLEDVENRCYYQIWTHIEAYDATRGEFRPWLSAVVRNQAKDYKRGLKATFKTMALDETYLADLETPPATEPLDFDALFTPLSPTERQVFQLYFIDDLTPQEIAAKLKMKRLAVYKHLSRGRLKLKQEVKQHDLN